MDQSHTGAAGATVAPNQLTEVAQKLEQPLRKIFGEHVTNIDSIDWKSTTHEFVAQLRRVGLDVTPYQGPEYAGR